LSSRVVSSGGYGYALKTYDVVESYSQLAYAVENQCIPAVEMCGIEPQSYINSAF
jgi:hypothetical protein